MGKLGVRWEKDGRAGSEVGEVGKRWEKIVERNGS